MCKERFYTKTMILDVIWSPIIFIIPILFIILVVGAIIGIVVLILVLVKQNADKRKLLENKEDVLENKIDK